MKKYLLVLLLVLSLLPAAFAEAASPAPEDAQMLSRVRQSVVRLYAVGYDREGEPVCRWTGTGFAVGPAGEDTDIFLTNWHVATGNGRFTSRNMRIWLLTDSGEFDGIHPLPHGSVECQILAAADEFPDVAVVRALDPVPGCKALPMMSSRGVPEGTEVYALGFPGFQAAENSEASGGEEMLVTRGSITGHLTMASAGNTPCLIHNAPISRGCSGGPLVNRQGVVVGQNAYGFPEDVTETLFCGVYTDWGMSLLDELGIEYTVVPGASAAAVFFAGLPAPLCLAALVLSLFIGKATVHYIRNTVRRSS